MTKITSRFPKIDIAHLFEDFLDGKKHWPDSFSESSPDASPSYCAQMFHTCPSSFAFHSRNLAENRTENSRRFLPHMEIIRARVRAMLSSVIRVGVSSSSGPFPPSSLGNLSSERRNRKLRSWLKIRHRYPSTIWGPRFDSHTAYIYRMSGFIWSLRETVIPPPSPEVLLNTDQSTWRVNSTKLSKRLSKMRMEVWSIFVRNIKRNWLLYIESRQALLQSFYIRAMHNIEFVSEREATKAFSVENSVIYHGGFARSRFQVADVSNAGSFSGEDSKVIELFHRHHLSHWFNSDDFVPIVCSCNFITIHYGWILLQFVIQYRYDQSCYSGELANFELTMTRLR